MDNPRTHAEREAAQRADEAAWLPTAVVAPTCFYCEHHGDGVVPATRQITFVDNDTPRAEWICDACARAYFPEHTHPCPTCRHARSCTCTVFVPGEPLECATCSNCRGW
jgi:hypothetical protein